MDREIKLVDIHAQYQEIRDRLFPAWEEVLASMRLMLGPNMKAFETEFAAYCGAHRAVGCDSGTTAILLPLRALGIGPGDVVLTVSMTFFATVEAVILAGAKPVMLDVDEDSCTMSVEALRRYLSEECRRDGDRLVEKAGGGTVKAILPVHLYGMPADLRAIMEIAAEYGLAVIEDCAQAHGAEFAGRRIGSFGQAASFSFYFSKNLSALGEGGIMLAADDRVADRLERLRLHGQTDKYTHAEIGYNARLDELQAVVLRLKLEKLDEWNEKRRRAAALYHEGLAGLPLQLPKSLPGRKEVYHLYVVRTPRRDELAAFLGARRIGCGIHYPLPCHLQPALAYLGYRPGSLPVTENLCSQVLSLPMHPHLEAGEVAEVCGAVREFFS